MIMKEIREPHKNGVPLTTYENEEDKPNTIVNGKLPYNVYLYWMDDYLGGSQYINSLPFSNAYSLISAQYCPYLTASDFRLIKVPYDKTRYGYDVELNPYVYRIDSFENFSTSHPGTKDKKLGQFLCYQPTKTIGGSRNWRNESKLYNYPYRYGFLFDGLCEPIEIRFENCSSNTSEVYSRLALNINGDYSLYVKGYRKDNLGEMEQTAISSSRDYPCSSSQYSSWLATNKNQIQATKTGAIVSLVGGIVGGVAGTLIAPGVGSVAGAALGAAAMASLSGGVSAFNTINQTKAQEKDMRNLPNSLISKGSDLTLGINTTEQSLNLYTYKQKEDVLERIGDYFAMFGYKQNKLMTPNLRDRYYYNFFKMNQVNIRTDPEVPKEHLESIRNIFRNGTTIWHVDRDGVSVCDYSKDNKEV